MNADATVAAKSTEDSPTRDPVCGMTAAVGYAVNTAGCLRGRKVSDVAAGETRDDGRATIIGDLRDTRLNGSFGGLGSRR